MVDLLGALAVAADGAALALALLAWEFFRGSPFGNLVAFLPVLLASFGALAVLSLSFPDATGVLELVEAVTFTWLLVFVVEMVRLHARHSRSPRGETDG